MFAQERPEYEAAADAVAGFFAMGGGIVAIDGRPGSGKTALTKYLSWRCHIAAIETDLFALHVGGRLAYRMDHIRDIIDGLRTKGNSVILDGAIAQETLAELGYSPDLVIRVSAVDAPESDEPLRSQLIDYEEHYQRVDLPLFLLPLPNEDAQGLRLTQDEWNEVQRMVNSEPEIRKAWIFGSRATGIRTPKQTPEPCDIDLAILPAWAWAFGDKEGIDIKSGSDFRARNAETIARRNIQIQWHGSGAESDAWHLRGRLICDRG